MTQLPPSAPRTVPSYQVSTVRPWYCCMRMSIAVVEPSGRNQTGSPLSSTMSGPEWLSLFGVDL